MKKKMYSALVLSMIIGSSTLFSCGGESKNNDTTTTETTETTEEVKETVPESTEATETTETTEETTTETIEEETVEGPDTSKGEAIFSDNGCVACHQVEIKTVGPSLKDISTAYNNNRQGLISFLKEESEAIVDPAQAAVMKPQLATTKEMGAEELGDLVDFLMNN